MAFTYADMLANICIHGRSASIQKMALVGTHKEMLDPYHHQVTTDQVPSAGLLNLATFHVVSEAHDGGELAVHFVCSSFFFPWRPDFIFLLIKLWSCLLFRSVCLALNFRTFYLFVSKTNSYLRIIFSMLG